jgi:hypothetical protein
MITWLHKNKGFLHNKLKKIYWHKQSKLNHITTNFASSVNQNFIEKLQKKKFKVKFLIINLIDKQFQNFSSLFFFGGGIFKYRPIYWVTRNSQQYSNLLKNKGVWIKICGFSVNQFTKFCDFTDR